MHLQEATAISRPTLCEIGVSPTQCKRFKISIRSCHLHNPRYWQQLMATRPRKQMRFMVSPTTDETDVAGAMLAHTRLPRNRNPSGAIEPSTLEPSITEKLSLRVEDALTGKVLLDISKDEATWPNEARWLYTFDVLSLLKIPEDEHPMFDLFHAEQQREPVQIAHLGKTYTLVKRACSRCTICNICCTRSGAHILCSHGSFAHLWCRPQHESSQCIVIVEGYSNGAGLSTRFSDDEITGELASIERQYNITTPEDFNRR